MSVPKRVLLYLMAVFYIFSGVMHLLRPDYYMPMMPAYLPWHAALIFLSGIAELGLAKSTAPACPPAPTKRRPPR